MSNGSTALGSSADGVAAQSTALGAYTVATGANSAAIGYGSVASEDNTVSVGTVGSERRVTNVAAGVGGTDAVNVSQLNSAIAAIPAVDVTALQTADTTLQNNINTETTARTTADTTLQNNINSEANARLAADTQLAQDLTTEQTQRAAADTALDNRVSALESSMANIGGQFKRLNDHIAAGTAVASAMSGNAFLPDMKFNLTTNVATYDGALAGALQMGAMVSRHTAVNAGVATGFNKGGKVAARVGMTFGW